MREHERGVPVDVVVLGGAGDPRPLTAHQLLGVGVGVRCEDGPAGEVARAAPLQSRVAGHLAALGGRGPEPQWLVMGVGEPDRPVQRPGAGRLVHRVHGQPAHLTRPLRAAVLDPGELLGDGEPVVLDGELGEPVVPHGADPFRQGEITLPVHIAVAAPEVLAGQMARRHLEALVPAVVAGPVPGHGVPGEGANGVGVGLAGLEGLRVGAVDVTEDLGAVRRRHRDVVAVRVGDADAHARSLGAQWGWSPCMAG